MNIFSVLLWIVGLVLLLAVHFNVPRKIVTIAMALFCLWLALGIHLVLKTEHLVSINWN